MMNDALLVAGVACVAYGSYQLATWLPWVIVGVVLVATSMGGAKRKIDK